MFRSKPWVPAGDFVHTGEEIIHEFKIQVCYSSIRKFCLITFLLQNVPENLKFLRYVKFDFKSNHGKKEFTCIYRVRVHGKLYIREATTENS